MVSLGPVKCGTKGRDLPSSITILVTIMTPNNDNICYNRGTALWRHVTPDEEDLRILLLGYRHGGKSSSGNTILGRVEFDTAGRTAQCVKRQGEVAGRHVTVVEAPGWDGISIEYAPNIIKEEIELSVSLCPPGPHILLLARDVDRSFTAEHRRSVQQHLELLGERVWSQTIVLFTHGDLLRDTPIEQHIESEGESLQWLVEKCGNRYHVLNNERRDDHMQVTQLMKKIEEMVAANRGQCYETDRWRIEELEEKRRRAEERGTERMMKVKRERESLRSQMGDFLHLSELRILLLGARYEGKSSSGNTILGREEFDTVGRTAQCVKRQGEVAGRHITVVDAPGWNTETTEETSIMTKEEIELSVSLCPPGPHALLLVIDVDKAFTEIYRISVQQHLELLGERVWNHTIVLFTCGDRLGDRPIEQYIESEGESLQWLVEKCGSRYHVFNNKKRDDNMQVTQLMEKIEEMVAANRGQCYEMERKRIEELEQKRRRDEERVKERRMTVKRERESFRSQMGDCLHLSELRIVLLGHRFAGKSSSGNTILGREEFETLRRTAQCVKKHREVARRHITVVEAPGWWGSATESAMYLIDKPFNLPKKDIKHSMYQCLPGPHAILLVIGVDMAITRTYRRSVQEHLELLGERVWSHTIVLFTCGDWLGDTPIEQHIESEGESLKWLVEKCGNRYHVLNNKRRDDHMQVTQLMEKIEKMVAANRGQCYEMDRQRIEELEEKWRRDEESGKDRMMKVKRERDSLRSLMGDSHHLSELRIVLLGHRFAGKSSTGNTIIGRKEFDTDGRTAKCVKRQGEVAGRHVTVVEAPGWNTSTIQETPNMTKEEIELSVFLCRPGLHALLLVICVRRSFIEERIRSVQEHLALLGERVWSQTIVLFTCGDWLGDTAIEKHIESEGESLQWLVEKCGNRYHVLNNKRRDDHMQVTQLMEKIEEMVAANRGQCYENRQEQQQHLRKARSYDLVPPNMSGASGEDTERWSVSSTASSSSRYRPASDISSLYGSIRSTVSFQSSGYESLSSGGSVRSFGSEKMELAKRMGLSNILEVYDESEHIHEDTREKKPSRKDKYIDFDCP
ncbi:GTPase IMAP family member 8-like [Engraulis encrasicolus]|uniref:GTPase IMAP family member 8-like n=1 Tax=Engraulis encrasicolus TaxID=184585 RepID=UPI002FD574FC